MKGLTVYTRDEYQLAGAGYVAITALVQLASRQLSRQMTEYPDFVSSMSAKVKFTLQGETCLVRLTYANLPSTICDIFKLSTLQENKVFTVLL